MASFFFTYAHWQARLVQSSLDQYCCPPSFILRDAIVDQTSISALVCDLPLASPAACRSLILGGFSTASTVGPCHPLENALSSTFGVNCVNLPSRLGSTCLISRLSNRKRGLGVDAENSLLHSLLILGKSLLFLLLSLVAAVGDTYMLASQGPTTPWVITAAVVAGQR